MQKYRAIRTGRPGLVITGVVVLILAAVATIGITTTQQEGRLWQWIAIAPGRIIDGVTANGPVTVTQPVRELEIHWVSCSVTIQQAESGDALGFEETAKSLPERGRLVYVQNGDKLIIHAFADQASQWFAGRSAKALTVRVPAGWDLRQLKIDSVSGTVLVSNQTAAKASVDTVSGDVKLVSFTCDDLSVDTVSGRLSLQGNDKEITFNSISGSADLAPGGGLQTLNADTVSGSITLALPAGRGFTAVCSAVGDAAVSTGPFEITQKDGKMVHGDGAAKLRMDTVSGRLRLEAAEEPAE
ncbi:MAG: DUF4097 domain-containing protein [Oscillospiraceae bacterium]|jgi:hypothetical protein|nr:DUF4097 domain-containing protein [Oscillospiraceae bacterium]